MMLDFQVVLARVWVLCAPARLVRSAASWQLVAAAGAEPEPLNLQLVSATNSCYPAPGHRAPGSCSCTCTFSSPGAGSGEGEGAPVLPRQCPYSIIVSVSSPRLSLSPPPSLSPRLTWRPYHVTLTTTATDVELLSVRHHELCHHQSQLCIVEQLDIFLMFKYFYSIILQMATGGQSWQRDAADQNFDYMFKLLIIGNSSVGKTSFLFRYADDSFTSAFVSTVGIDFKVKTVFRQDKRVKLQIWVGT